jgi:putative hemolysin
MISELLIIFLLILLNGVFAMSEIAMVSLRRSKLEAAAKKGDNRAQTALDMHNEPTRFLSTVQIGITLISILIGIFSGDTLKEPLVGWISKIGFLEQYADSVALSVVVILITGLSLLMGELVPKRIGLAYAEGIAILMASPMNLLSRVSQPFIWLLTTLSNGIIKLFGLRSTNDDRVTEEEIKAMIQEGTNSGEIDEIEQDIVERVFHLGDRRLGSLMTHRSDIIWLDINLEPNQIRETIRAEVHSVYPVCDGDLDKAKGIVYLKNLFLENDNERFSGLSRYVKPVLFLPENNTAYTALEKFKETKIHYALVVDEYGSVQGLVTINDILEAIVGEFEELDVDDYTITQRTDNTYLIDGGYPFYEFLVYFDLEEMVVLDELDYNTVAGCIIDELDRIPSEGEKIRWNNYEFEVLDMDGTRIDKVLFYKFDEEEEERGETDS